MNNLGTWENCHQNYLYIYIHGDFKILEHVLIDLSKNLLLEE